MTEEAIATITQLESAPEMPDGAGLRIAANPEDGSLMLGFAAAPEKDDEVITTSGAVLFLDQQASEALADKTLDAQQAPDGRVMFSLIDETTR
ncbi:MAG TPA: hypothetical protein VF062_00875 [Candidatus Limnocylindrales bacterium]